MNKAYLLLVIAFLSGCATPYQSSSFSGGYSDSRLGDSIFRVSFEGNGYTKSARTVDLALLRSAELALQNDFKYFVVVSNDNKNSYSSFSTPHTTTKTGTVNMYGNNGTVNTHSVTSGGQTYLISKPSTTNIIACFKNKPKGSGVVYDASFIVQSLRSKYEIH